MIDFFEEYLPILLNFGIVIFIALIFLLIFRGLGASKSKKQAMSVQAKALEVMHETNNKLEVMLYEIRQINQKIK